MIRKRGSPLTPVESRPRKHSADEAGDEGATDMTIPERWLAPSPPLAVDDEFGEYDEEGDASAGPLVRRADEARVLEAMDIVDMVPPGNGPPEMEDAER